MAYDGTNNPKPPVYSQAKPTGKSCTGGADPNANFYVPAITGKTTLVLAGEQIRVDDLSNSEQDIFKVHQDHVEQLTVNLTTIARINDVQQTLPVLSGETVDEVNLSWSYNQAIATQSLVNNGGLAQPLLGPLDVKKDYVGVSVTETTVFTVSGDTGEGLDPESKADDSDTISFGNYLIWGKGESLDGKALSEAQAYATSFINLGQVATRTSRQMTVTGIGALPKEKFFLMWPVAWGIGGDFDVGSSIQSMYRVKNVGGVLKHALDGGTETAININNQSTGGFTEPYYIYESFFGQLDNLLIKIL